MFASNILVAREAELREVRERKRILQEQLNPERTFPTSSLGRAKSSTLPAYPNKSRFAVSGLVIGLFMAVLLSLWRSYVFVDKKY